MKNDSEEESQPSLREERERRTRAILVVDDEESLRYTFSRFLADEGFEVTAARDYASALENVTRGRFDLVFADIILGSLTGIDLLREIRDRDPVCPVVMVTGYPNLDTATEAVRLGAFDYLSKPVTQDKLLHTARLALAHRDLVDEKERYRANLESIFRSVKDGIVTVDDALGVIEINDAAQRICGMSRTMALGRSFRSLTMGCRGKCLEILEKTIETGMPQELFRVECHSPANSRHVVTLTTSPLDARTGPAGAVMVVRDETQLSELERNLEERKGFFNIVGTSPPMQRVYGLIENLADIDTTVLITGESGTGKELVAEALHYHGVRSDKPLVKVNCSALSESILESELFGHVKGAFTGAVADKQGRFERANGGTMFLDEIADISPKIQVQLLRVLQEKEFERVGDSRPVKVDVRVIVATNKDLRDLVDRGQFRDDLFYRLKVVDIPLAPLRDRREDIPLLSEHFLREFNRKFGKNIEGVTEEVIGLITRYEWPGNVRELKHLFEHAAIMCRGRLISADCLPADFAPGSVRYDAAAALPDSGLSERERIFSALERTDWNKAKTARVLGMSRQTLYRKIQELGIAKGGGD